MIFLAFNFRLDGHQVVHFKTKADLFRKHILWTWLHALYVEVFDGLKYCIQVLSFVTQTRFCYYMTNTLNSNERSMTIRQFIRLPFINLTFFCSTASNPYIYASSQWALTTALTAGTTAAFAAGRFTTSHTDVAGAHLRNCSLSIVYQYWWCSRSQSYDQEGG